MEHTINRSVWGTSTDDFKRHYRTYLNALAELDDDSCRAELLEALEWCFDRWDYWRQKFYPSTDSPLLFPFFQSERGGSEFGHYSTMGSSGQPSVIHIKRSLLLGTSDITVMKSGPTAKLVLKADHPKRLLFVERVILHELVHQYLHEGAPEAIRSQYESTESGRNRHKGHGSLFAEECNRINEILLPEIGFKFVPVRHVKRDRGPLSDRQRPSCSQFGYGELLSAWDIYKEEPLEPDQLEETRQRFEQALEYFDGALSWKQEAAKIKTDFLAPFDISCADTCHQQLTAYDQENKTDLVMAFQLKVLNQLQKEEKLESGLRSIGYSADLSNISPASSQNGNGCLKVIPELGPVVPTTGDNRLSLADTYPISDPIKSLKRLESDWKKAGSKVALSRDHFELTSGSVLSRHLKKLKTEIKKLAEAA